MPWFFSIPEFLKKRACRYLLQHYMGQFLAEKISLEDLTVDLYSGTGTITNVDINVEAINEVLVGTSAPVRVLSGYIGRVTVSVPWTALLKDSCKVEISGLALSIVPYISPSTAADEPVAMTDSLFFSMTTSLQLAEEVLKSGPSPGETSAESTPGFEGMEALARAIELVLARVQITLRDTVVQVNYETADHTLEYFLKLRVKSIQFYDELSQQESSVDGETEDLPQPVSMVTKVLQLSGLSVEFDYTHLTNVNLREEQDPLRETLTALSPPAFNADAEDILRQSSSDSAESEEDSKGVPIALANGEICVRVKLRQSDSVQEPKLEVEGNLAALHILLSPQQLQMLLEMATGITSQGSAPGFSRIPPGQNRPIPKTDMRTIESQLQHHVREERQRKQRREDLLHADPWESSLRQGAGGRGGGGGLLESSYSSATEQFFSLELGSSVTEASGGTRDGEVDKPTDFLDDSFHADSSSRAHAGAHVHGRLFNSGGNLDNIPLHEGLGLQQLSQSPRQVHRRAGGSGGGWGRNSSPPTQRSRSDTASSASGSSCGSMQSTTSRQVYMEFLQHDLCRYTFTVSGVTVALLETDPPHIHKTPGPTTKWPPGSRSDGRYSSLDEGGLDPLRYFESVAELLKSGVNRRVLQGVQERLAQVLPTDHLFLWLSTVRASVNSEGSLMDLDLSVASAELWEYLYHNEANLPHITRPVSVAPIVQLVEDSVQSKPCIKLKLSTCMDTSKKRSASDQQTNIELSLTTAHVNLDVTLVDRAQPLLTAPLHSRQTSMRSSSLEKMKHSLYMTTSNYHTVNLQRQAVFNQAVAVESAGRRDHRTSIRADCGSLDISLRFPIPDLRKDKRPPWYHSSLRPEALYVVLASVGLSTVLHSGGLQHPTSFDAHCSTAKAYLSCDGSPESRELFMTVGPLTGQQGDMFSDARIKVEVQPIPDSVLEDPAKGPRGGGVSGKDGGRGYSSLEEEMALLGKDSKPSPFSHRKDMVSTGKVVEDSGSEENVVVHSEELVMPGSPAEMAGFEQHASSTAQYSISCSLPSVHIHLPSRTFLETLYNRLGSDLVLWEPASPAVAERTNARSMLLSCMDVIQPAVTKEERFQMCKSVLKEEDSDEEGYEEAGLLSTMVETPQQPGPSGLSLLALTLAISSGRLSMLTAVEPTAGPDSSSAPLKQEHEKEYEDSPPTPSLYESANFEPDERLLDLSPRTTSRPEGGGGGVAGERGLVVVTFSDARLFIASGYLGDASHDYLCGQIKELSIGHLGSLEAANCPLYSCVDDAADHTLLDKLLSVVYKSEEGARLRSGSHDQPTIAIAMEMKLDAERNTKTNKCAVALRDTTLRYHMTTAEHSCFKQLGDFFSLTEEQVPGYEPPSYITELHVHTFGCALEYRPLHLPLRALLTVDSVSLSTNVVTGSPLLVVRLMVDETLLFLSNKQEGSTSLQQDYVCVMELDWFQMTLRLCNNAEGDSDYQKVFSRLPEISMECSSNVLHLRTCVDSCMALRDLLVYMATYGDLQAHPPSYPTQTRAYSSLAAESSSSLSSQNSYSSSPPLASLKNEDIGDLISEAMEDTSSPESSSHRQTTKSTERHKHRHGPKKDSKANLQIHMSNEKSVHMVFNSDSEDEGHPGSAPDFSSRESYGPRSPRGLPSSPKQDSIFSESDDDFCILDAPTTTKVAPGARPVVKTLLEEGEELKIIENHFAIPDRRTDQLQRPKSFPEPVMQYTLKEITVVWHMYGGRDFSLPPKSSATSSPGSSPLNARRLPRDRGHNNPSRTRTTSGGGSGSGSSNVRLYPSGQSPAAGRKHLQRGAKSSVGGHASGDASKLAKGTRVKGSVGDWKATGGPGRDHAVLMEIELDKVRFQHETYPADTEQVSRVVLLVHNAEVRDRLANSQINKFLYQYTTDARPRQSHANMVSLKVLFTRPELEASPSIEEAAVRLSLLPIRLNIDQDAVFFLYEFIKQVTDTNIPPMSEPIRISGSSEVAAESGGEAVSGSSSSDVFIKSFVFQPELPIRIDYEGKRFQMEAVGTLAGILLGLSHLDCSEVTLKSLTYKKGLLGWDKLVEFATNEWIDEIKSSQLPLILKGVGPMHHVTQLFLGMKDLVWLPWEQYQEDGRIVRGLQRGASAFTTSTGVAFVELTGRLLHTVQSMAQMAYDLVSPGNQQSSSQALVHQHKAPHQPLDFREGVANAYDVVTAGIGGTARDLIYTAALDHEERGMTGAVGGVLRQLPGTLVKPIILASEATRHVLGGMKNQFVPDARREANEKWRTSDSAD